MKTFEERIRELAAEAEREDVRALLEHAAAVQGAWRPAKVRFRQRNCPGCDKSGGVVYEGQKRVTPSA